MSSCSQLPRSSITFFSFEDLRRFYGWLVRTHHDILCRGMVPV
ncbi:Glucan endo-1 [Psidium guajava]|nr:Glucan endo-1 [Psidium guajava]